ncbi:hypothetical protein Tco_0785233 [Tanacetum coccineum]
MFKTVTKNGTFARECKFQRSKDNRNWNQRSSSKAVRIEDASEKAKYDTAFKASTYKRGLSILEAQVVKYKESEVLFSEEIALLKRSVGHKDYLMGLVKTELEKVKEEKEGFEFKLAKFEKSSKDLDALLASQVTDKSKRGFGYTAVPSPHPLILNRPTPLDLSYSGLEEFQHPEMNGYGPRDSSLKPTNVCDRESNNSKENTDDSLTQQPKTGTETRSAVTPLKVDNEWKEKLFHPANNVRLEEPKKARENHDASQLLEDGCQDDEVEVVLFPRKKKKANEPMQLRRNKLAKFDGKSDEGFFVGYSLRSNKLLGYQHRTRKLQKTVHYKQEEIPAYIPHKIKIVSFMPIFWKVLILVKILQLQSVEDCTNTEVNIEHHDDCMFQDDGNARGNYYIQASKCMGSCKILPKGHSLLYKMGPTQETRNEERGELCGEIEAIRIFLAMLLIWFHCLSNGLSKVLSYMAKFKKRCMIYVEDIIYWIYNKELLKKFEKLMKDKFQMIPMGELNYICGFASSTRRIKAYLLSQPDKYVMRSYRSINYTDRSLPPLTTDLGKGPLIKDEMQYVYEQLYRFMIGSLMYLQHLRPISCCSVVHVQEFCDKHNMVAFLEKSTGSAGFHQIIDFLNRSHICYALTKKPEVCVSFIKQFWRSAEASTDDNGEVAIKATIDGHSLSITEGSLR